MDFASITPVIPILGAFQPEMIIPIIAIILGLSIPLLAIVVNYKRKKHLFELYHQERMAAISKGLEIPPLPAELLTDVERPRVARGKEILRKGLVWLFVGFGITVSLYALDSKESALLGTIPMGVGVANLLYYAIAGRKEDSEVSTPVQPETKKA